MTCAKLTRYDDTTTLISEVRARLVAVMLVMAEGAKLIERETRRSAVDA